MQSLTSGSAARHTSEPTPTRGARSWPGTMPQRLGVSPSVSSRSWRIHYASVRGFTPRPFNSLSALNQSSWSDPIGRPRSCQNSYARTAISLSSPLKRVIRAPSKRPLPLPALLQVHYRSPTGATGVVVPGSGYPWHSRQTVVAPGSR